MEEAESGATGKSPFFNSAAAEGEAVKVVTLFADDRAVNKTVTQSYVSTRSRGGPTNALPNTGQLVDDRAVYKTV